MSFHLLMSLVLVAAAVHVWRLEGRTRQRSAEIVMRYVLVAYCGVPMIGVAVVALWNGPWVADVLGFPPNNPFETFMAVAYLGLAVIATLAARHRGTYLIGPALAWSIFFAGATVIHLQDYHDRDALNHRVVLLILASHGLVSVVLLTALALGGARENPPPAP